MGSYELAKMGLASWADSAWVTEHLASVLVKHVINFNTS